jgi:hypothetical protein
MFLAANLTLRSLHGIALDGWMGGIYLFSFLRLLPSCSWALDLRWRYDRDDDIEWNGLTWIERCDGVWVRVVPRCEYGVWQVSCRVTNEGPHVRSAK